MTTDLITVKQVTKTYGSKNKEIFLNRKNTLKNQKNRGKIRFSSVFSFAFLRIFTGYMGGRVMVTTVPCPGTLEKWT